jgi:PhoPQ-activated pathogenicity-related protein
MKKGMFRSGFAVISFVCLVLATPLLAQTTGAATMHRDVLAGLKHALQAAGANPLSAGQEQQLQTLVTSYRTAHKGWTPDTVLQSARHELENAIMAKDTAGVKDASAKIAAEISNQANTRIQDMANFGIQALGVLSGDQISALQNQIGATGILRILRSMAGGFNRAARFGRMRFR